MTRARKAGRPTEQEYRDVMASDVFSDDERRAVALMRRQLTERGITAEPLRTRLACEFAELLLTARPRQKETP